MRLTKILLPITRNGTSDSCAAAAFSLAGRSGAELEVLHPCLSPSARLPYSTELSPVYFDELADVGKKQVALEKRQAKQWFAKVARGHPKTRAGLIAIEGLIAPTVSTRAKASDLTVLPAGATKEDEFWRSARDAALFQSGRPVLVVPKEARGTIGTSVVIAWKDAVEAVRAVAASRPLLAEAKRIRLVAISEQISDPDPTAAAMIDYLKLAGLRVELAELALDSRPVGEVLLNEASGEGALLVMGAYGRWRWREWIFGGATHYVLHHTPVPVLMMH